MRRAGQESFAVITLPRPAQVVFVTEILSSGSLKRFITKVQVIRWKIVKRWCKQILRALAYLHSQNPPIIHRDIKCDNIFINGTTGDLRIGDLGLSTTAMIERNGKGQSVLGTPEFMAPELYDEEYDEKVDIYAFGMCVVEMITKQLPYAECANPTQIYRKVTANVLPRALELVPEGHAYKFIWCCVNMDPKLRWSAEQLLQHEFLMNDPEFDETEIRIREQPLPQIPEGAGLSMPPPPPPQLAPAQAPSHDEPASGAHPGANTEALPPPPQLNVHDDVDASTTTTTTTVSSSPQPHKQRRLRLKETLRLALMTATDAYVAASQAATGALAAARALTRHQGLEEEEDDDEDSDDGDYVDDRVRREDVSPHRRDSQSAPSQTDIPAAETPEASAKAEPSPPSTAYFTPVIQTDFDADVPPSGSNHISSSHSASDFNGDSPVVEQRAGAHEGPSDASTDAVDEDSLTLLRPTGLGVNPSHDPTLVTEQSSTSPGFSPPHLHDAQVPQPDEVVPSSETPGPVVETAVLSENAKVCKAIEASNSESVTRSSVPQSRSDQPVPASSDDEFRSDHGDAPAPPPSGALVRGSRPSNLDDSPQSKRDFDSEEYFNSMEDAEKLENKKRIRVLEGREKRRADDDSDFPAGSHRPPAPAAVAPSTVAAPRPAVQQRASPSSVHEFQPPPTGRTVVHAPNVVTVPNPPVSDKPGPDQVKNGVIPAHSARHQNEASPVTLAGSSGRPPIAATQGSGTKHQPAPAPSGMARPPLPLQQRTSSTGLTTSAPARGQSQRAQSPGPSGGLEPQHTRPPIPVTQRAPSPGPTGHRTHQAKDNKDVGTRIPAQANGVDHRRVRADSDGPPPAQQKPRLRPSSAPSSRYSAHRRQDEDVNDSAPSTPSRTRGHSSKHHHGDPPAVPSPETPPQGRRSSSSIGMPPIASTNDNGSWEHHPLQRLAQPGDSRYQEANDHYHTSHVAPTAMNEATQAVPGVHGMRVSAAPQPRVRSTPVPVPYGPPALSVSDGTSTYSTQVFEADAVPRQEVERESSDERRSDNERHRNEHFGPLGSFDDDYESIDSQVVSEPIGDDLVRLSFPYSFDGIMQRVSFEYNLREDPRDIADEFANEMGYPPEEMRPFADFLASVRHRNRSHKRIPKLGPDMTRDMPSHAPASGHPFSASNSGSPMFPLGLLQPRSEANPYLTSLADQTSGLGGMPMTYHPTSDQESADTRGRLVAHRDDDAESLRISAADLGTESPDGSGFLTDEIASRLSTLDEFLDNVGVYIDEEDEEEQRRLNEEYTIMRMRVKNIHEDRLDKLQHSRQDCVLSHEQAAAKFEEQMRNLGRKERDITTSKEAIRSDHERVMKKYEKDMQDYDRKFRIEHAAYSKRLHDFDQEFRQKQDEVRKRARAKQLQQQQLCRENSQSSSVSSDHHHTPAPSATTPALPVQPALSTALSNLSQ